MLTSKERKLLIEEQNRRVILKEAISKYNPTFIEQAEKCKAEDKVTPGTFFYQIEAGIERFENMEDVVSLIKKIEQNRKSDAQPFEYLVQVAIDMHNGRA